MRFKAILLILCLVVSYPIMALSDETYLNVTAPGNRILKLTIAPPVAIAGSEDKKVSDDLAGIFRFDLTLAGPFDVQPPPASPGEGGIAPGTFDLTPWKLAGDDLLLRSGYSVKNGNIVVECHLYDLSSGSELTAKRFIGGPGELRLMAHLFSDEVMRALTGDKGPFSGKIAFVSKATGNKEIYLMDYDGHNVQRITSNGSINLNPAFSPTDREIVFTSYKSGNPDLYRRELYSGSEACISRRRGLNIGGAWAPDGKRIALSMSVRGNPQIYVIDRDGKLLARLTHDSDIDISPSWSPDASRIAFVSDREGAPQIFIMDANGKNIHRLTYNGNYNVSPSWSPKGDRIAYCRREGGSFQIYAINPDGSGDTRLTDMGRNEHPRWSPDGRFLTFSSTRGGGGEIYVMRGDGTAQTRVSRNRGSDSQPAWTSW